MLVVISVRPETCSTGRGAWACQNPSVSDSRMLAGGWKWRRGRSEDYVFYGEMLMHDGMGLGGCRCRMLMCASLSSQRRS